MKLCDACTPLEREAVFLVRRFHAYVGQLCTKHANILRGQNEIGVRLELLERDEKADTLPAPAEQAPLTQNELAELRCMLSFFRNGGRP